MIKDNLKKLRQVAARVACLLMVTVAVWGGAWSPGAMQSAMAVGSEAAGAVVNERAAAELDRVAGAGTSDQLEGAVQGAVGSVKRGAADLSDKIDGADLDSLGNRLDGATDELAGKVKRDVGRTKSAADDLGDDVEESAEGFVESIKDFFD